MARTPRVDKGLPVSAAWRTWLAENLLLAVPPERVVAALVASGFEKVVAEAEVAAALASPILIGARSVANAARRHALVARLARESAKLVPDARLVERRSGVARDEFFERYYGPGRPVVLTDTFTHWPLLARWSPLTFGERLGDSVVEVTTGRDDDPATHTHFKNPSARMTMLDLCERVANGETNAFYLIANDFDEGAALAPLRSDLVSGHPLIGDERDGRCIILWFGPNGTVTPLHHDTKNVLLCQVYGRKRVLLFPRYELPLAGASPDSLYRPVDLRRAAPFPELAESHSFDVTLSPGDALFIPVGCFHQVTALDASISIGFSNFRSANRFDWFEPGKIR